MVSKGYYRFSEIPWEKRWSMAFQNHEINTKVHTPLYFGETVSAILSYGIYDMFESKYKKRMVGSPGSPRMAAACQAPHAIRDTGLFTGFTLCGYGMT